MTVRRLTLRDWRLFFQAVATLAICRARLRRQDFAKVRAWASRKGRGVAPINRLTWSIEAASKRMKGTTCLAKALALQRLLAQNGHDSELRIGVNRSEGLLTAHAWLVCRGHVLVGGAEIGAHTLLAAWASRDAPAENG
ncbi:MAG: lasso peptide biosynthesis B2 protein [Methylocystis sp.]